MDEYIKVKQNQITIYEKKMFEYHATARRYAFYEGLLWLTIIVSAVMGWIGFEILVEGGSGGLFLVSLPIFGMAITGEVIVFQLRRHAMKSSTLLHQFTTELKNALKGIDFEKTKNRILTIETNFLSNDDELYTKKFIWRHFLEYLDIKMEFDKDEKEIRMDQLRRAMEMPTVWMKENPLDIDNDDTGFVELNWMIKRRLRELFFQNYGQQRAILEELGEEASSNSIVYERFLRNKKVSKKLKKFKKIAWVFYLSAAAKMKLIYFVDSVLQDRPYVDQCDEMKELINEKNEQIRKYTADFWRIHRRSLKFYLFEMIWISLLIPVLIFSIIVFDLSGMTLAFITFLIGASIVVYGEMALVTRQLRDLKSKKLVPSLIASLMGIRHSMCSSVGTDPEVAKKYAGYFKEAEKHFMLTVTEVEAVKYAKDNVVEKVTEKLSDECLALREEKDKQAHKYYERFNHYRNQCVKYGAIEAFVALLVIPVVVLAFYRTAVMGGLFFEIYMELGFIAVGLAVEFVLLMRHIRVDRRKELFLLIYQKMSVILSDYTIFSDVERLLATTGELEESIIDAASSDNMHDVVTYVRDWQEDNQRRNQQLIDDMDMVYDQLPIKGAIESVGKKIEEFRDRKDND